ncbi:MAG: AbrB/MazE/SpoVT family DNA-binding domain-containing protein [Bacilli bacterium]|nr:AbrB/MazE/SpoVT family DNA-binding domain-containing protein [Bacilli bacterium]
MVIPQDIRKMFDIKPGDTLIVLADKNKGIAILKSELVEQLAEKGVVNE